MMDPRILDKIKKCLSLSKSDNEHEAAAALRQARALMAQYQVTAEQMAAADVKEAGAKAGAAARPAAWETYLSGIVAEAMDCDVIMIRHGRTADWQFIGVAPSHEVAAYAMTVLLRQVRQARAEYIATALKRVQRSITKTKRADLFCLAWCHQVEKLVQAFASRTPEAKRVITAYKEQTYPKIGKLAVTDRVGDRRLRDHELRDLHAGRMAGKDARLDRGIGGTADTTALIAHKLSP